MEFFLHFVFYFTEDDDDLLLVTEDGLLGFRPADAGVAVEVRVVVLCSSSSFSSTSRDCNRSNKELDDSSGDDSCVASLLP